MRPICTIVIVALVFLNCETANRKDVAKTSGKTASSCIPEGVFNRNDTAGTIKGLVAAFAATSDFVNISLLGKDGDTILFMGSPAEIGNYDSLRLSSHPCVEISYRAKILRMEDDGSVDGNPGDEAERDFYITEIKYPDR